LVRNHRSGQENTEKTGGGLDKKHTKSRSSGDKTLNNLNDKSEIVKRKRGRKGTSTKVGSGKAQTDNNKGTNCPKGKRGREAGGRGGD